MHQQSVLAEASAAVEGGGINIGDSGLEYGVLCSSGLGLS